MFPRIAKSAASFSHVLNFEACDNGVDARITTTGGANWTRVNGAGNVVAVTGARIDHNPVGRTNHSPNNSWVGAAAGAPGTLPNLWAWFTSTGLNRQIVGVGVEGGRRYMDLRIYGTATSGGTLVLYTSQIAALTGQTWTTSMYIRVVAGTAAPLAYYLNIAEYTSGGAYIRESFSAPLTLATSGPLANARQAFTRTLSGGGTVANLGSQLYMIVSNGAVVDVTLRLAVQQTERAAAASADIFTFGSAVTVFDSLGLLQEPTVRNETRNNTMLGVVAGSPGTPPLRWNLGTSSGTFTRTIVGSGVEDGIPYVDIRCQFTGASPNAVAIAWESPTQIAALAGETWTTQAYLRVVAGSFANLDAIIYINELNVSGTYLTNSTSTILTVTGAALKTQLLKHTRTLTDGLTRYVHPGIYFYNGSGVADVTIRIGAPQAAKLLFATAPVLTSDAALTATPATHFLSGSNFSSYFTPQGTYLIEFTPYALTNLDVYWGIGQANVFGNSMYLVNNAGSLGLYVISGGVAQATLDLGPLVAGTRYKVGISYQAGEIAARVNGGTERVSSGAMPAVIDTEGLLVTPWNGGASYPAAHMHVRKYKPVPGRGDLYALTV